MFGITIRFDTEESRVGDCNLYKNPTCVAINLTRYSITYVLNLINDFIALVSLVNCHCILFSVHYFIIIYKFSILYSKVFIIVDTDC